MDAHSAKRKDGSRLQELIKVLPALSRSQSLKLLNKLRKDSFPARNAQRLGYSIRDMRFAGLRWASDYANDRRNSGAIPPEYRSVYHRVVVSLQVFSGAIPVQS